MTRTCIPMSKARYSAMVWAILGVTMRSMGGSSARFSTSTDLLRAPVFSNSSLK